MSHKKNIVLIASIASMFFCLSSFAGQWQQDGIGWRYQNDDGSYVTNAWHQDPDQLWYYLGPDGYMLHDQWINGMYYVGSNGAMLKNTVTPDGYRVGADGAWIQDGGSGTITTNITPNSTIEDLANNLRGTVNGLFPSSDYSVSVTTGKNQNENLVIKIELPNELDPNTAESRASALTQYRQELQDLRDSYSAQSGRPIDLTVSVFHRNNGLNAKRYWAKTEGNPNPSSSTANTSFTKTEGSSTNNNASGVNNTDPNVIEGRYYMLTDDGKSYRPMVYLDIRKRPGVLEYTEHFATLEPTVRKWYLKTSDGSSSMYVDETGDYTFTVSGRAAIYKWRYGNPIYYARID